MSTVEEDPDEVSDTAENDAEIASESEEENGGLEDMEH